MSRKRHESKWNDLPGDEALNGEDGSPREEPDASGDPAAAEPNLIEEGEIGRSGATADLQQECAEWKERALRAAADLENFRRRSAMEAQNARKYANEGLIYDLLPVLDNGHVIHRFCETLRSLSPYEVTEVGNLLGEMLGDMPVSKASQASPTVEGAAHYEEILRSLLGIITAGIAGEEGEIFLEGASHILEQPEFRESDRVEPLVRFLEERKTAFETLHQVLREASVKVTIGQENPHEAMREVSMVAARYSAGSRSYGWVAVLGPTRMHYAQAVPAVQYVARALSETLARLGLD
jgi:hypothetical protein